MLNEGNQSFGLSRPSLYACQFLCIGIVYVEKRNFCNIFRELETITIRDWKQNFLPWFHFIKRENFFKDLVCLSLKVYTFKSSIKRSYFIFSRSYIRQSIYSVLRSYELQRSGCKLSLQTILVCDEYYIYSPVSHTWFVPCISSITSPKSLTALIEATVIEIRRNFIQENRLTHRTITKQFHGYQMIVFCASASRLKWI